MYAMLDEKQKIDDLLQLGIDLGQVLDLDVLMERVLTEARKFAQADAGSIYIAAKKQLCFSYTQNDTLQKRLLSKEKLFYNTFSLDINEESIAGHVALSGQILNIADVYKLSTDLKYHFNKSFDETSNYRTRSMLTLPLTTPGGKVLGVIQIINKTVDTEVVAFDSADEKLMLHFSSIASVALERAQATRSNLLRMVQMAELRDPKETGNHVKRVGGYTVAIYERWARNNNTSEQEILSFKDVLHMASMLHDVGKVGISDKILKKEGKLTNEEYGVMKTHTTLGANLFQNSESDFDRIVTDVAINHHEKWDGTGYPGVPTGEIVDGKPAYRGKRGEEIPLSGRICAIADVFDALISTRVYKKAWNEERVLEYLKGAAGTQFDPELIDVFFSIKDEIFSIRQKFNDNHREKQ